MEDMDVLGLNDVFLLQVIDSSAVAEHICFKQDRNMFEFDYALVKDTQIILYAVYVCVVRSCLLWQKCRPVSFVCV